MTFDLYGSLPTKATPIMTTIDALHATEWTRIVQDTLELSWADHTKYHDGVPCGGGAEWTCQLSIEDGRWVFDFEHGFRGGPQEGNSTGLDASTPSAEAQVQVK